MPQSRPIERKLTTILAADAANYSGLMHKDEEGTVRALRGAREVIDTAIAGAGGRIANTSGDGLIAEFPSVVSAVKCAIAVQVSLNGRDDLLPFRLGVHLGDVIVEGQDLLGDGVNLAARLQEVAEVGGILISQQVVDHVRGKVGAAELRPLGPTDLKHLSPDIGVYAVVADGVVAPRLPDNLGPKVRPAPEPHTRATVPDTARADAYERFRKSRNGLLGGLGAVIAADILFGAPFWVMIVPEAILLTLLYRRWRRYQSEITTPTN